MSRHRHTSPDLRRLAFSLRWVSGQSRHDTHVPRSPFANAIYFGRAGAFSGQHEGPPRKPYTLDEDGHFIPMESPAEYHARIGSDLPAPAHKSGGAS